MIFLSLLHLSNSLGLRGHILGKFTCELLIMKDGKGIVGTLQLSILSLASWLWYTVLDLLERGCLLLCDSELEQC